MEMYVKIAEVRPLAQHTYEDKNGQPIVFKSKGFVFHNGNNSFYCEAKGKYAEVLEQREFNLSQWYVADYNVSMRRYNDSNGEERFSNDVELHRINLV